MARGLLAAIAIATTNGCGEAAPDHSEALSEINKATIGGMRGGFMLLPGDGLEMEAAVIRLRKTGVADGAITAEGGYCRAPHKQASQINDCFSRDGVWMPIQFTAALVDLDPATAKISEGTFMAGRVSMRPYSLLVSCHESAGKCVTDTVYKPSSMLSLPCRDKAACDAALPAFRELVGGS